MQQWRLGDRQLACVDHAEHGAVERPVGAADEQHGGEHEDRQQADPADRPADECEEAADPDQEQPGLHDVARCDQRATQPSSGSPRPSSSSRPRGGQSSF